MHRAPSQRPDLLLSIQTACDLPLWIICKYIYFDFVHNMILFRRLACCTHFFLHSNLLWEKERMKTQLLLLFLCKNNPIIFFYFNFKKF